MGRQVTQLQHKHPNCARKGKGKIAGSLRKSERRRGLQILGGGPFFPLSSVAGRPLGGGTEGLVALRNLCCPSAPVPAAPLSDPEEVMGGGCWKAKNESEDTDNLVQENPGKQEVNT